MGFSTRDIILHLVEGKPIIIVMSGFTVKDSLRYNLTARPSGSSSVSACAVRAPNGPAISDLRLKIYYTKIYSSSTLFIPV